MSAEETRRSEFAVAWKVLLAATVGVTCGASPLPFNAIGFFLAPVNEELGWSYGEISFAITVFGLTCAVLAPFCGAWADRFGVRPVAFASLAAFALAFGALAFTPSSLVGFYALWVLVGATGIGCTQLTWSRGVNLWFFRSRGLALGIMLVGTSLAVVLVPPLTVFLIERFGWRMAFPLLALLPLAVALPVAWLFFREPRREERPAALRNSGTLAGLPGVTLGAALRDYRFWVLFGSILCVAFAYGGLHVHMAPLAQLHGLSVEQAAAVVSMLGFSILAGRLLTGVLFDRYWAPLVTLPLLSLPALSCWILIGESVTFPSAIIAALFLGSAAGAESDLIAYLAGRYFGMAHYGRIYGVLYVPFTVASAVSPAVYGWVRDATGDYEAIITVAGGLFVFGALALLALGRYPNVQAGGELADAAPGGR